MPSIDGLDNHAGPRELWRHSSPQHTKMYDFMKRVSQKHGVSLDGYHDLWQWSVSEPAKFWGDVWQYTAVKAHKPYGTVSMSYPHDNGIS